MSKAKIKTNARAILMPVLGLASLAGLASVVMLGATKDADAISAIFSVEVPGTPEISVTIDDAAVGLKMEPTQATANFQSGTFTVKVGTSSSRGYSLSMSPRSTQLTNEETSGVIDSINLDMTNFPNGYTATDFTSAAATTNKWGYKMHDSEYFLPIPNQAIEISSNNKETNPVEVSVDFGVKVDAHLTGGTYQNVIDFVAVANPSPSISSIKYMQDLNAFNAADIAALKDTMTTNQSYLLEDRRDGQKYWITKLQTSSDNPRVTASSDGNKYQIWMTQNLNLDLTRVTDTVSNVSQQLTLNSNNTDIHVGKTGIYATDYYTTSGGTIWWNPGRTTDTDVAQTANSQVNPYSLTYGDKWYYQDATVSTACDTADQSGTAYYGCMHWHVGNYYNWSAAVASSDSTAQSTNGYEAANSICPAGWRLPSGITVAKTAEGSTATSLEGSSDFGYLLVQHGITSAYGTAGQNTGWSTGGYSNIQAAPLYITRSGYFNGGQFNGQAADGDLWSGTTLSATNGYSLYYNSGGVYPAGNSYRNLGFPVRCIARES